MAYFPFFMDIENVRCLIIGGGRQAEQKLLKLLPFGAKISIISPDISEGVRRCQKDSEKQVELIERTFMESDLESEPMFVIIALEGNAEDRDTAKERERIAKLCRMKKILVNSVDDRENCDFFFPSLVIKDNITIGISSGGTAPGKAMELRKQIENEIN